MKRRKKKKYALQLNIYTNPEKRTVVAKITNVHNVFRDILSDLKLSRLITDELYDKITIKDEYIGKAKCSPEDTFNNEVGIKLATMKAQLKYSAAVAKNLWTIERYIDDILDSAKIEEDSYYEYTIDLSKKYFDYLKTI
jgi:hypothetical protein